LYVLRRTLGELDRIEVRTGAAVEAPEQERERLAEMAEREPRTREAIEHASKHQPQGVGAGLEGPLPRRPPQALVAVEHGSGRDRIGGVEVDKCAQLLRPLPERVKRGMVEVLAAGVPVDHRSGKRELAHAALELIGRGLCILHGKVREAGIAVAAPADLACKEIVRLARLAA